MLTTAHIQYGLHTVSKADIQAVVDVLLSDFLTQGHVVPAFEEAVANYCEDKFGISTDKPMIISTGIGTEIEIRIKTRGHLYEVKK